MENKIYKDINEFKNTWNFTKKGYYLGYVYLIEYGDYIKIGCTRNPLNRFKTLSNTARVHDQMIGRIYITQVHTNYRNNESIMHKHFQKQRKENTELFFITLEEGVQAIKDIPLLFEDKSEILEADAGRFVEAIKEIWQNIYQPSCNLIDAMFLNLFLKLYMNERMLYNQVTDLQEELMECEDIINIPENIFDSIMNLYTYPNKDFESVARFSSEDREKILEIVDAMMKL